MKPNTCDTCAAFAPTDEKGQKGTCHCRPPTVLLAGVQPPRFPGGAAMPITVSAWPMVSAGDWCTLWLGRYVVDEPVLHPEGGPWQVPAPGPLWPGADAVTVTEDGISLTVVKAPENLHPVDRHPGSDTFPAVLPSAPADYTSTHKPRRSPGGNWFCLRCDIAEAMFASTRCTEADLPPAGVLATAEEDQQH